MGLRKYLVRRVLDSIVVILLILLLNFLLFYRARPEIADLPVADQLTSYLRFIFVDFFRAADYERDLMPSIISNLPFTLFLWAASIAAVVALSISLGTIAAYKPKSKINAFLTILLVSLFLVPSWWVGTVLQKYLHSFLPLGNWYSTSIWSLVSPWSNPFGFAQDFLWHMILPVTCLTLGTVGVYFLVVRNSMLGLLNEDFVIVLKAKGVSARKILFKHIFRNAILPITALAALTPLIVINAAVTVERVFSLTGIGYFLYRSAVSPAGWVQETPNAAIQAIFLILAFLMVSLQFIFDVAHHSLDPRLRIDGGQAKLTGKRYSPRRKEFWRRFAKRKSGIVGLLVLMSFALVAVLAPVLPLYDPEDALSFAEAAPPNFRNFIGTDEWGRDVLSRLVWGTRISLFEFLAALSISLLIGCCVGLLSGYYSGRWFSYLLDRTTDVFVSIPLLIFVIFFPLEPGYAKWIISIGLATWGITAKIARSQILALREKAYIEAARSAGAGDKRIILHYILPEVFPVIASSMIYTSTLIISLQSTLDFFGFRRNLSSTIDPVKTPNIITWGGIMSFGSSTFIAGNAWWIAVPPAICMALLGLSIVYIADAIAYASNPHLEGYPEKKDGAIKRLHHKIKRHKLATSATLAAIILIVALATVPTPHIRTYSETRSNLEKWVGCGGALTSGTRHQWESSNLSSSIRIVVNVSSSENTRISVATSEGEIKNSIGTIHDYTLNATGPYIRIDLENPASEEQLAIAEGYISVYSDYEAQVSYVEWLPWWRP
jgi:peptide/nickel transport system permease protein